MIAWHEISHTIINDLTLKYYDPNKHKKIIPSDKLIFKIYNSVDSLVSEYIVRAITLLLERDKDCAEELLNYTIFEGFNEVENIKDYILKNYSVNNKFTINNDYSKLIEYVIDRINKSYSA
jgi:hypothetical protein